MKAFIVKRTMEKNVSNRSIECVRLKINYNVVWPLDKLYRHEAKCSCENFRRNRNKILLFNEIRAFDFGIQTISVSF